jgi:DNA helicase-2/ATP-dependent DNA helicase PcrA
VLIRERNARRASANAVELPVRISASRFKDYVSSPAEVAGALRRPMPERPYRQTRLGTVFHGWVEQRAEAVAAADIVDGLPEDDDLEFDDFAEAADLERLKEIFERSEWATLAPSYVELEIHLPFAGQIVVCKIDAVYRRGERWEIVDWKTGAPPKNAADYEQKQYQLALYRLAFSRYLDVPLDDIDAAFYYLSEDRIIRPEALLTEEELEDRWSAAVTG